MQIKLLKAKIHRATVTSADLNYQGSISIDPELCSRAGIRQWEAIDIYDVTNGERFSTYVILGKPGEITLNGAAARKVQIGDKVILATFGYYTTDEADNHKPNIILVDDQNKPID